MSGKLTYKTLYQQVRAEISKRQTYNTKSAPKEQLSRIGITPSSAQGAGEISISDIVASIQSFLQDALPSFIRSGLLVVASDPENDKVTVQSGSGVAGGALYELEDDVELTIPFDGVTEVFYINLYKDNIQIDKDQAGKKLTVAKIIVPTPGVTSRIRDDKDGSDDAYIINYQEYKLHGNGAGVFEEDSFELLRNNIGAILADNIIGNIRLSENLKIINTQGTMEMDSQEIRILNGDDVVLAKFNRHGTFFFDENGIETAHFTEDSARFGDFELVDGEVRILNGSTLLAKFTTNGIFFYNSSGDILSQFTVTGASIGNITITPTSLQSSNYVEGVSGFIINDDGYAEFENVRVRGILNTTVFEKDTISAIGGKFFVTDSDVLVEDMTALDASTFKVNALTLTIGDILRIKDGFNEEWLQVASSLGGNEYTVTRDLKGEYASNSNPVWTAGTAFVNYGSSGEGFIYMTSSDDNSPHLSVITHTGTPWVSVSERLRLGRLDGFLDYPEEGDSDYAGPYYGIAIGEITKYLKYDPDGGLVIRGNFTMDGGFIGGEEGWQITGNEIIGSEHSVIRGGMSAYAVGSGFWLGFDDGSGDSDAYKFAIGDLDNYLRWDGETLHIKGSLIMGEGSSIGSGVITADSFVDTVTGDLSIGAVFAKKSLESNIKWLQFQTEAMLNEPTATYDCPSGESFETAEGILQIPTIDRWDISGEVWDVSGETWDASAVLGTYIFTSDVKDTGANFNQLPIMTAYKNIDSPNNVSVQIRYSEDNVTWSEYQDAYPSELNSITTWYFSNIVKCRYIQYQITFEISDATLTSYLSNIYYKSLALYKTLIFPDFVFSGIDNRIIQDLDDHFSKEYSISFTPQGTGSLIRPQIVSKSNPPSTLELRVANESNASVAAVGDLTLIGY